MGIRDGRVVELDLSRSGITTLPKEIGNLSELQTLSLSQCSSLENRWECDDGTTFEHRDGTGWSQEEDEQGIFYAHEDGRDQDEHPNVELVPYSGPCKHCGKAKEEHLIPALPPSIGDCKSLTSLNMERCFSLQSLPEGVFELPLKSLNIGGCKKLPLDVIDTICQKLPQLEELYLYELDMTAIPDEISKLQNLTDLDFQGTAITAVPDSISKLQNLKELNLARTAITALPKEIGNLSELQTLNLYDCWSLEVDKSQLQAQLPNCAFIGLGDSDSDY